MRAHKPPPRIDLESRVQFRPDLFKGYVLEVDSYTLYIPAELVEVFFTTVEIWRLDRSDAANKTEVNDGRA